MAKKKNLTNTGKDDKLSISNSFIKGCAGKTQHKSRLSAEYYLENLHSKTDAGIYECVECGFFHIGTPNNLNNNSQKKYIRKLNTGKNNDQEHRRKHKRFKY